LKEPEITANNASHTLAYKNNQLSSSIFAMETQKIGDSRFK